ncbi:MAG: hypothetical protein HRU41_41680 [Saprospiraceae bacterium]|nr:hypothetical protein [Saprospiraceae bacterium]
MKWIILLLSLGTCLTSCQHPVGIDIDGEDEVITPLDTPLQVGPYLYQGTFDLGAETLTLGNHSGRLLQICNLAIHFRPYQYITHMGGRYPTLFFLIKDVYPNDNPDHFIYERDFELEFITDEPCGDEFDLLDWYTGPWDNKHAFLAAVLHPSLLNCWAEGTFEFALPTNFQLECPGM